SEGSASTLAVTAGQNATANAALSDVTLITGTVTDQASGLPVANICLYLYAAGGARTADPGVCTLSNGSYALPVAAAGSYDVAFVDPTATHTTQWWNGAATQGAATPVPVTANQTAGGINAALAP
ncbi:MAG TPA: hypothetical protein VKY26_01340, partial [Actinomycetota bacterium]|nr:hypothetical protein [Actinomycetota bacterium]